MKQMTTNANALGKIKEPTRTLRKIRDTIGCSAIIAGGYYRDLYNGIAFSDVDIYLRGDDGDFNDAYWTNFFNLQTSNFLSKDSIQTLSETNGEYDVANNARIIAVFGMVMNEVRYNLIVVDCDPIEYVHNRFDFGICKVYCDGTKITFTEEFMADVLNKTLTFSDHEFSKSNFNHAMHVHYVKLKEKYPDYTLVVPKRHQKRFQEYKKFII